MTLGKAMRLWLRLASMRSFQGLLEEARRGSIEGALRICRAHLEELRAKGGTGPIEPLPEAELLVEAVRVGLERGLLDACLRNGLLEETERGYRARPYLLALAASEVAQSLTERSYVITGKALATAAVRALHRAPMIYLRDEERFLFCALLLFGLTASLRELGAEEELFSKKLDRSEAMAEPALRRLLAMAGAG
jgi:hypothetical protein